MSDAPERIWAWPHETPTYCSKRDPSSNRDAIEYRRADLPPTPDQIMADPRVIALVERVEQLNAACDAMWNDFDRVESRSNWQGGDYAIKEVHCKAISEAQQRLPAAIAAIKDQTE